jgi:thiol-disulfide isomerase/thioredoxin
MRVPLLVLTATLALLSSTACSTSTAGEAGGGTEAGYVEGDGSITLVPTEDRKPAPELSGQLLGGGTFDAASQAGNVLVVNVWGSWCPPCRAEASGLDRVAEATASQGVQFVGLNTRDTEAAARSFVTAYEISYPSIVDRDGQLQLAFRNSLPMASIPSTVVVDREGRSAARVLGPIQASALRDLIEDVAAETP